MSMFGDKDLFASGPHRLEAGGLMLRHVVQAGVGGEGVQVMSQGRQGRRLVQKGELLGDTVEEVRAQAQAIEAMLDGSGYELVDDVGRLWTDVVMLSFEAGELRRVGGRWAVGYRVEYLQTKVA